MTAADTDADVLTFSGRPDSIVLTARTNGALFTITDRLSRQNHPVAVLAGQTVETHLTGDRVRVRNLVAGSNAAVSVHGKWAERGERA